MLRVDLKIPSPSPFPTRDTLWILIPTYFQNQHSCVMAPIDLSTFQMQDSDWGGKKERNINGSMGAILYSRTRQNILMSIWNVEPTRKCKMGTIQSQWISSSMKINVVYERSKNCPSEGHGWFRKCNWTWKNHLDNIAKPVISRTWLTPEQCTGYMIKIVRLCSVLECVCVCADEHACGTKGRHCMVSSPFFIFGGRISHWTTQPVELI